MIEVVKITLNRGRESSVLRRHPWIFSGAVKKLEGKPVNGQTVEVYSSDNQWLGRGSYSAGSQITVRLLSFEEDEPIDSNFFQNRISRAIAMRNAIPGIGQFNSFRLIYGESDGLPGVIADRYDEYMVCQFLSAGAEFWKDEIVRLLKELWPCRGIYERSDTDSRKKEGFTERVGVLEGQAPPQYIEIQEGDLKFLVDLHKGHKTGFYLDQRVNRQILKKYAEDREVLNAFSYTGGFGISAGTGQSALVTNIDTSEDCLELAGRNFRLNNVPEDRFTMAEGDVFNLLRTYRDSRRQFDLIVLDPPKFVASAGQLSGGSRGYKDINLLAFKLLKPGGILFTFSCSGYVRPEFFQKIVSDAAIDSGRDAEILEFLSQSPDHPVGLNFPEGLYLKGLVCRVF
jgi:23S rRNA (cytosine1962-C5)-methyltransferase